MSIEKTTLRIIDQKLSSNNERAYWKAACDLSNYIDSAKDIERIWPMVVKYSSSRNPDLRLAMACCILEHILQFYFEIYFDKCKQIVINGNLLFGDTLSYCSKLGQVREIKNRKKFDALLGTFKKLKILNKSSRKMKASFLILQLNKRSSKLSKL